MLSPRSASPKVTEPSAEPHKLIAPQVTVIAVIALLFGSTQIPKLARSLGSARKEFEQGLSFDERHPAEDEKSA